MPRLWRDGRAVVLLQPAEWLACIRVLKSFLHVSACPDVLLCTDCALVVCVTVIGWSGGVIWVSRHEQSVSLCRGVLRRCVWLSVPLCMPRLWRHGWAVVLLQPAEWLAWIRVLKWFLHVSACPDVLLCFQWQGGGLYLWSSSSATITSSKVSGNSAVSFACAPLGALCCVPACQCMP